MTLALPGSAGDDTVATEEVAPVQIFMTGQGRQDAQPVFGARIVYAGFVVQHPALGIEPATPVRNPHIEFVVFVNAPGDHDLARRPGLLGGVDQLELAHPVYLALVRIEVVQRRPKKDRDGFAGQVTGVGPGPGGLAVNGQEALDKAVSGNYDLILMDMHMPVMDGHEATQILRDKGYDGLIVAVTASVMSADSEKAINSGCDEYIPKPIGADFEDQVETLLAQT